MKIHLWGTDFRRSSREFRKGLSIPLEERKRKIAELIALGFTDLVYLWTCNRIEFYTTAKDHFVDTKPQWLKLLSHLGLPEEAYYQGYHLEGKSALRHLLRVSSSLESLVVGEPQILGQMKDVIQWTKSENLPLDKSLEKNFQFAFEIAKKIRTETQIAERPVSIASLGLKYFEEHEKEIPLKKVVIVGRGPISQNILQWYLRNRPQVSILWVNRRKELLSDEGGRVEVASLAEFLNNTPDFSHLFTATASLEPIFKSEFFDPIEGKVLLVDFGEPSDIEKMDKKNIKLIQLDDLKSEAAENTLSRKEAILASEKLIEDSLKIYFQEQKEAPILKEFSRGETQLLNLLDETYHYIENEFPHEIQATLKKMAEKILKKNLHQSREHLRTVLRDIIEHPTHSSPL